MFNLLDNNDLPNENGLIENDIRDINEVRGKLIKLTPERAEAFKQQFDCVVVNDFGDDYHLSEEERKANNEFYSIFKALNKCKHRYSNVVDYINASRKALKCLEAVAERNGRFKKQKFMKMVLNKKIKVGGLFFPILKGRANKTISREYLTEYILSGEPAEDFFSEPETNFIDHLTTQEQDKYLLDDKMRYEISNITDEDSKYSYLTYEKGNESEDVNIILPLSDKDFKKLSKEFPDLYDAIKEDYRSKKYINDLSGLVHESSYSDYSELEEVGEYGQGYGNIKFLSKMPEFKGDMSNSKDYNKYLLKLEEWENTQIEYDYNGKFLTKEQIQSLEMKIEFDKNGINIRNLYSYKDEEKKLKKLKKKQLQKEKKIRKKLNKVRIKNNAIGAHDKKTEKKKKKAMKKQERDVDNLANKVDSIYKSFDDYEESMVNSSWDY